MSRTLGLSPALAAIASLAVRRGLPLHVQAHDEALTSLTLAELNALAVRQLPAQALEAEGRRVLTKALELLHAASAARRGDYYR